MLPSNLVSLILLGVATLGALGCQPETQPSPVIARVGHVELTEDDLRAAVDSSRAGTLSVQGYINNWVVTEVLYQEAVRRGLMESPHMGRRLETVRKRLAVAALLEDEIYDDLDTLAISESMLSSYLDSAAQEFLLQEDVLLVSYVTFDDRAIANRFRGAAFRGGSWDAALESARQDSQIMSHVVHIVDRSYQTEGTLYPQELWSLARSLGIGDVSFVLRPQSQSLYYVIKIHNLKTRGALPDLAYVRDRVRDRILVGVRRKKYQNLVASLRLRQRIEIGTLRSDSLEQRGE